jgi:DNA-directed RNA polymerase specialized sigma24 family protein
MSGKIELLAGDAAAAERHLRAGFDHMTAMGDTAFAAPIATRLAEAVVLQGRIDEAFELTELVAENCRRASTDELAAPSEEQLKCLRDALAVHEATRGLPASQRELLRRRIVEGQDEATSAAALGIAAETVAEQLRAARMRLRSRLKRDRNSAGPARQRQHDRA